MSQLDAPQDRARRALDRLAFGPRPGDVPRVAELGPELWIRTELGRPDPPDDPPVPTPPVRRPRSKQATREMREEMREIGIALGTRRLERAVAGEHRLHEVAFEFWANHLHVYARKGLAEPALLPSYERDVLRRFALGRFEDLLLASAQHPAMLFYLDNWRSRAPESQRRRFRPFARFRPTGLNENYARELLELHTLGVDGGYTQQDVVEVARAFTGWTLKRRDDDPGFHFRNDWHDDGPKRILGHAFPAGGGRDEGERVIRLLAHHPSTARFLATKLARRFLADDPPPTAVERTAARFLESGGDIRATLETLLLGGPELFATELRKLKQPYELLVSAVRSTGARIEDGRGALFALRDLGQLPYMAPSPAGWPDRAERWLDPGSVLARTRFAFLLASGRLPGIAGAASVPAQALLPRPVGPPTRVALATPGLADWERTALALASPEFQLR